MDILKDKQTKSYDSVSRYSSFPFYYNTKYDKYIYGITSQLDDGTSYSVHTITYRDSLDSLSLKYYGRPDYFWIIADFNRIRDPFIKLSEHYKTIKIPSLSSINFIK